MSGEEIKEIKPIPIGTGSPDISVIEATVSSLSKAVVNLEQNIKEQRNENRNIIIGVVIAFIAIVVTVAVEVILSNCYNSDLQNQYFQEVQKLQEKNYQTELRLQSQIDSLKLSGMGKLPLKTEAQK